MDYQNIDLINGVQSLKTDELKDINGGSIIIGLFVATAFYLLSEYDSIKKGWEDAASGKDYNYEACPCNK